MKSYTTQQKILTSNKLQKCNKVTYKLQNEPSTANNVRYSLKGNSNEILQTLTHYVDETITALLQRAAD